MRYSAFISYNHVDRKWADWLHRSIERYVVPPSLRGRNGPLGPLGRRLPPVFQDREELATSANLAQSVQDALKEAATLIVICSPNAARSRWVNEEIKTFTALGRANRVLCLVVDGEPGPRDPSDPLACFPPALLEAGLEPLAADIRPHADGKQSGLLKLIAGVIGVGYDELRRRDATRRQRRLVALASLSTAGLAITSALAIFALWSREEAIAQRDLARQRTVTAERTVDFVKSMFAVSDPSEAKGSTVTAREILDRGARQILSGLTDEPAVKAELLLSLGEVYTGLGLYRQGDALIRSTFRIEGRDPRTLPRQYAALGESQALQASYSQALRSFDRGLVAARDPLRPTPAMEPRLLGGISEARSALKDFENANEAARLAIRRATVEFGLSSPEVARAREALGLSAFFAGDLRRARLLFASAMQTRLKKQGDLHPKVTEDLNMLGSIAYLQGDIPTAEQYFQRVVETAQIVLGPNHPDVASFLANLGRVQLEQRHFAIAASSFTRANAIYARQRNSTHDDLAFTYANLGLAERNLGHSDVAAALFTKAIRVARIRRHRNLAPTLADMADLECERGNVAAGLALAAQARPLMATDYRHDPWRIAWVSFVEGFCLAMSGDTATGVPQMRVSAEAVMKRWPAKTLYGETVRQRLEKLAAR